MIDKHQAIHWFTRLLAVGIIGCGAVISYSGIAFLAQSSEPFQENLRAIKGTIQELDTTVVGLRNQSDAFDKYLEFLELSLADTKLSLDQIDKQSSELFDLTGTSSVKLLNESAAAMTNASKLVRDTANQAGGIPFDPLAEQRKSLYAMAGNFRAISSELKVVATKMGEQTTEFKKITASSLATAKSMVKTTETPINLFRTGPVERMPDVLESLSKQLGAHVKLIDASFGLLMQVSLPVIAVGVGFMLLGIWGLVIRRSPVNTSRPFNGCDPKPWSESVTAISNARALMEGLVAKDDKL
jgi:hypothetical protein